MTKPWTIISIDENNTVNLNIITGHVDSERAKENAQAQIGNQTILAMVPGDHKYTVLPNKTYG